MKIMKIDFKLDVDDGYPPIDVERLNAREINDNKYEIMNSPFFVKELAYGDIVIASEVAEGRLLFLECIQESKYKAISIIIFSEEMDRALMDLLRGHDCIIEYGEFGGIRMVAVGIPAGVNYTPIKERLEKYEGDGKISYAELVV